MTSRRSLPQSSQPARFGRGTISLARRGQILIVALDRLQVKNAFNNDVYLDLVDVLQQVEQDNSLVAIVLTGTGSHFSSGLDLKAFKSNPGAMGSQTLEGPTGQFMMKLIGFSKIIAVAVNGPAVGIGVTLLPHCDLVICAERASFWTPFTRLAIVPELCSSITFPETMGLAKANELLLLGKKIDAKTAVDWNLCSQVVPNTVTDNPFHPNSLASHLCGQLEKKLLSLPLSQKTATYFVALIRGSRKHRMQQVCRRELCKLDERGEKGHILEALQALKIGRSKL